MKHDVSRRRLIRAVVALAVAAGTVSALAAASGSAIGAQQSTTKPTFTIGVDSTAGPNLNPSDDDGPSPLTLLSYTGLVHENPDGSFGAGLATSWHYVGNDNTTFQLTLRHDARFSDGTQVTAAAVKTWLEYFAGAKGPLVAQLNLKSVSTVGQWTVVLHEKSPTPGLPYILSGDIGYVASPGAVAKPSSLDNATDGAGPYVLVPSQSVANSQYTFVPNKYYYDPSAIRFGTVVVKVIAQPSTMLEAIRSGQLDVAQGDITTVSQAKSAGLTVESAPGGFDQVLILDRAAMSPDGSTPNPLAKVGVRQALNYAINRPAITKAIMGTYGTPTSEIGSRDGIDPAVANYYTYDPTKAKALLAAAGYPNGFTLDLPSQTTFGTVVDPTMEAVAQDLAAVGVQLKVISTSTLTQWVNDVLGGTYPVAGFEATAFPPLATWYGYWFQPGGIENQHGWVDPTMDKLYQQAIVSKSPDTYWKAITRRIVTQADTIPLFDFDAFWLSAKNVGGVSFSAEDGIPDPSEWYLK